MITRSLSDFAYEALRDIGCLRPGQRTSTDVLNDIFSAGNEMFEAWKLDELLVNSEEISTFPLVAGQQIYTIGPTEVAPNFTGDRPTRIEFANIILGTVYPVVRQPVEILRDPAEWARIRLQIIPYSIPQKLYYDGGYNSTGAGMIYLWPGPQSNYQLELYTWQQFAQFADLNTAYSFPPGYARLIRKALGVEIAPMMRMYAKVPGPGGIRSYDQAMLAMVQKQADDAREAVESYNAPEPAVVVDPAFTGSSRRGSFNYGTGDIGGPR
jgi:hypothetical protein